MPVKYFPSSRPRGAVVLLAASFLLIAALAFAASRMHGAHAWWVAAGALALVGLLTWARERANKPIMYELGAGELVLRRGDATELLPLGTVLDVNLIDRFTARDLGREVPPAGPDGNSQPARLETRFCGVPVGMGRAAAIYAGLAHLSMRDFRRSFVLLRVQGGGAYLLSPKNGSSMVSAITRHLEAGKEGAP